MNKQKVAGSKQLVVLALVCALAYVSVTFFRVPVVLFLSYEPKDCLLAIAGLLYGPIPALIVSVTVSLLEMVTISTTGIIGMVMNVLSSALFVCPAAWIYQRKRTLNDAILGLVVGAILMSGGMVLWNWLITPLYMGIPRQAVAELLLPAFFPFNLLKASLNAVLTVLLYKSVVTALRKAHLVPEREAAMSSLPKKRIWLIGLAMLAVLVTALVLWRLIP